MYRNRIKRMIAIVMSLCGIICLSWLYIILIIAIKIDSPGPVFFKQKRVGIHKKHFQILKFRTMRTDTPHDMPTHMLENPDQYTRRVCQEKCVSFFVSFFTSVNLFCCLQIYHHHF